MGAMFLLYCFYKERDYVHLNFIISVALILLWVYVGFMLISELEKYWVALGLCRFLFIFLVAVISNFLQIVAIAASLIN